MSEKKPSPVRSPEDFLVFGAPAIEESEIDEVIATMRSGWLGTGPRTAEFEKQLCEYKGAQHAVAVNSCTAALHLSLLAAGIGEGDEVITTPMTFCATVNAIIHAGATPVLADIEPDSMNIDPQRIEEKISARTRAILPVHFAGRACDMDAVCALATKHDLLIIEDCAHAIETEYKGQKAGTIGDFGCFSFYVTKNVATGEGGMILVANPEHERRLRSLSLHGMSRDAWKRFSTGGYRHYQVVEAGFKYNMMDLQAAIGIHQLARVESNWKIRRDIWAAYDEGLRDLPVRRPNTGPTENRHAYHLYTILVDETECGISRDDFLTEMTAQGIGLGVHYLSVPEHAYYQEAFGWSSDDYPVATRVGRETVSLPLSAKMTREDVDDVIRAVGRVLSSAR